MAEAKEIEIEVCLLSIRECFAYSVGKRQTAEGYHCGTWRLDKPLWTGGLKLITLGEILKIRLEKDKKIFCESAPIDCTSPIASIIERVLDSSRYFVIKVIDPGSKRATHLGIGFREKSDAFDFNAVIQDHLTVSKRQAAVDAKTEVEEEEEMAGLSSHFSSLTTPLKIVLQGMKAKDATSPDSSERTTLPLSPPPSDRTSSNEVLDKKAFMLSPPPEMDSVSPKPASNATGPSKQSAGGPDEEEWGDFTSVS